MQDKYQRNINYLRISVTDRCNLRCRYCMPEEGVEDLGHYTILSLEDLARLIRVATTIGIRKVRLTGGEPLIRKNIGQLIHYIAQIREIDDIALTTNGILYNPMAKQLKDAGLNRINISLDTLSAVKYRYITRWGELEDVRQAINKALELNMHPVKINTVIIRGFNDDEIIDFTRLAYDYPLHLRFIEFMPIGDLHYWKPERVINVNEVKNRIEEEYELKVDKTIKGNGPAKTYQLVGGQGSIGFIAPMSNHFCGVCNRIRMTADGKLRGCLYDKREIDLKNALKSGASDEELALLFKTAIIMKPERHHMNNGWGNENQRKMFQIGG
ncbi:MAG: GTP 3',8-cyclase MoaA [Syntrophomonadaceae bacterium]|jgi:cyclic pyranopterin phosphate synthase